MARSIYPSSRLCQRYQVFFFMAFLLISIQLYLGYNFYSINQEELRNLEEWRQKTYSNTSLTNRYHNLLKQPSETQYELGQKNNVLHQNVRLPKVNVLGAETSKTYTDFQVEKSSQHKVDGVKEFKSRCQITEYNDKEAYSALQRAVSIKCKQEIADVVCSQKEGKLFTQKELPNYCPLRTQRRGQYLGCFKDSKEKRTLPDLNKNFPTDNSVDTCVLMCLQSGYEYAGVEWGVECYCAESFKESRAITLAEENCNTACSGNAALHCGGYNAIGIYTTGAGARKYNYPPLVDVDSVPLDVPKSRIVFILTLNGRALRQVYRLIKALYHQDHYILIHVDSRQEYLHRELSRVTSSYSNIHMAPERHATIWGGANLTTMLLSCIRYLFSQTDWDWDFIINLSESDFPIRPVEELIAFLTMNKDINFLKSHGKDTPRFIKKQGVERTFVQCDNRMWRVGERKLPRGIRIDGGSDWVALNREFCRYLVSSNDELVQGLREYWKYTLLPGESYWHTVLQNSRFCTTFGNNNLHVVNWMRKKGCKCQYKAIVDWCGCSPNDFIDGDMPKLMSLHEKKKVVFFARKFEAIVSQEIINQLDAYLHGSYPPGTPGLASYWENIYTCEDKTSTISDLHHTFYHTFADAALNEFSQLSTQGRCHMSVLDIEQVHVFKQVDVFQGLLVKMRAVSTSENTTHTLEALLQYKPMVQLYGSGEAVSRLKKIETGLNFDPKEDFFRSHGNLMGPYSTFTVALFWVNGPAMRITVSVIDPAQVIANSFEMDIKNTEHALPLVMDFDQPIRPGIWTVKLQHQWTIFAESHFLVSPYLFYGGRPIGDHEALRLHNGPNGNYVKDKDHRNIVHLLDLDDPKLAASVAIRNAAKTGKHLTEWISDLIHKFWTVSEICSTAPILSCRTLQRCNQTTWSSMSPDPKSELGPINTETGRIR